MDSFAKSTSTKRFVVEDTFTKVTSDGQPHGMMTMIAGISGLLAAIVILSVLASIIGCKKSRRSKNCKNCPGSVQSKESIKRQPSVISDDVLSTKRFSFLSFIRRGSSITRDTLNDDADTKPRLVSISCISNGNFEGNLNTAFIGSEFNLSGSLRKKSPRQDVISNKTAAAKETIIDMEKY